MSGMAGKIKTSHIVLLIINITLLLTFGTVFVLRKNFEFAIYVGVIVACLALVTLTFWRVAYSIATLWGLTIWSIMHMAGGGIYINGVRLYDIIIITLSQTYPILRYDQVVHTFGFAAATLTMFDLLRLLLKENLNRFIALSVVVIMAGLGVGALNEIVEALVSAIIPSSGVGGYLNTSLDLIADLIGAIIAMAFIKLRYLRCDTRR